MRGVSRKSSSVGTIFALVFAQNAIVGVAILLPFVGANGVSLKEFFILQSIFSIATLLLEVPSGYLSDRWGRKKTLVTASLFTLMAVALYSSGTNFWWFLAAELLYAVKVSFNSGTMDALLYDTLSEEGRTDHSRSSTRKLLVAQFSAEVCAAVIGGLIAVWSLRAAVAATLPFALAAFVLAVCIREPQRKRMQDPHHWESIKTVCRDTLVRSPALRGVIGVYGIIATMTLCLVWFGQPYQEQAGLPLALFGIAHAVFLLGTVLGARVTERLEKRWDDRKILLGIAALIAASYAGLSMWLGLPGLVFLFFGRAAFGALHPVTTDIINHLTSSDKRATVLSIQSLTMRLLFAIVAPVIGYVSDAFSLREAILWTGVGGAAALLVTFLLMRPIWRTLPR